MTLELTQEQIVTNLLTSNQILKKIDNHFDISNDNSNLGDFLSNIPKEELVAESIKDSKYAFIQDNLWKF